MVFIILGFITFFVSAATMLIAFFMGSAAGMSGTHVALIMLVALYGMYQSTIIMTHEVD
jgi:hypothetical protein